MSDGLDDLLSILFLEDIVIPYLNVVVEGVTNLPDGVANRELLKELFLLRDGSGAAVHRRLIEPELRESLLRIVELLLDAFALFERLLCLGVFPEKEFAVLDVVNVFTDLLLLISDALLELLYVAVTLIIDL